MKNKKLLKAIAATIVCSSMALTAFSFAACNPDNGGDDKDDGPHYHTYSTGDDWAYDGNYHWRYATCEHTDKIKGKEAHTWENDVCTVCKAPRQIIRPTLSEEDDEVPVLDADNKMEVKYSINASDFKDQTLTADLTRNIFTVDKGTEIRTRKRTSEDGTLNFANSFKLNSPIRVNAPAEGTLKIYVQNGSSGATQATLSVDGKSYSVASGASDTVAKLITVPVSAKKLITIGKASGGNSTNDIFLIEFETKLPVSDVEKIEVEDGGTVDFYMGQKFSAAGLAVNAVHKDTGLIKAVPLGRLEIDYSSFNSTKSGVYTIKVSYEKGGKKFTAEYSVTVYALQSISVLTFTTNGNKQTDFKQIYLKDQTFSPDGLTVQATAQSGEDVLSYNLSDEQYTLSAPDMSTTGEKTVTVTSKDDPTVSTEFKIYVVEKAAETQNTITVSVDPSKAVSSTNFKTVTQALTYLKNYAANVVKVINIADGEYYEKISIDIPNVHLVGSATNTPDGTTNNGVVLWYDALSGITDPSGKAYGTNGSASVTITSNATGFVAQNITFKNKYNTNALYNESRGITSNTQAVALLVESGSASFYNCKMTGYHDTLYSNKGSHYYRNCWIEGRTDYIFGQDAHAYFHGCTIYTVDAGKDDDNGGYVAAYQNSSTNFGPIFNGCHFRTPETGATEIALGRAWGANCKIVVINCDLDKGYSTAAHTNGTDKKQRYVTMSGNEPNPANMLEYNNTGAGSVDHSIPNTCTYMTQDAAAAYDIANLATILGFTPMNPEAETHDVTVTVVTGSGNVNLGTVTAEDGQKISEDQIKQLIAGNDTYKAYDLVGVYSDEGCLTDYDYPAISADGNVYVKLHFETAFTSSVNINFKTDANYAALAESGKLVVTSATDGVSPYKEIKNDCIGFNDGATLSFDVKVGTTISIDAYGGSYTNFTVKIDDVLKTDITGANAETGVLTDDCSFTVDSNCTVTIVCGANNYLKSISIDVPKTYALGETITLTNYDGASLEGGASGKWNGITITTDNGGKFASRVPGNNDIQCAVGTVLTFNVAAGVTADNITVISYQNTPVAAGTWTVTVTDGVATVECVGTASNHQYIMAIEIKEVTTSNN